MICEIISLTVILSTKSAKIECEDSRKITTRIIVGSKKTPTPLGKFKPQVIDSQGQVGFLQQVNGSWFAIHKNDKKLPQTGSLGCVRFEPGVFAKLQFTGNTVIEIIPG